LLKGSAFNTFLGGEARVKNGTGVSVIDVVPGIVQTAPSATSLTITPNDQSGARTFAISSPGIVRPIGTTIVQGDKVVVITIDGQVTAIVKVNVSSPATLPPGLKGKDNREGKLSPPGWSHGKKTGWQDNSGRGTQEDNDD
jgi:hypothetical protein